MNTDTDNNGGNGDHKLQGAFGNRGMQVNAISYGHPHAEDIIQECTDILRQSESGHLLVVLLDKKQVPIHVMKGRGESGYSAKMHTIFLQIPGKVTKASGEHVITLAKALHEAAQELAGFKSPDPLKDVMGYANFIHGRNLDSITETCLIIKELTKSSYFPVLLDSLEKLGLNDMYKAYIDGASRDELFEKYVEAYDRQIEGV